MEDGGCSEQKISNNSEIGQHILPVGNVYLHKVIYQPLADPGMGGPGGRPPTGQK